MTMRSTIEAMRGLLYLNAEAIDLQRQALDDDDAAWRSASSPIC